MPALLPCWHWLLALFSVLLADLRATSALCMQAGKSQPLHHTSDEFVCLVKALW